jgi:ubiquinone/menaquinone biosynthesis C-methylase UbiE
MYNKRRRGSWEHVSKWYNKLVGREGQYYHQKVIIPGALRLLRLQKDSSLLDLGCGQGVFARSVHQIAYYEGVDLSPSLLSYARKSVKDHRFVFTEGDITRSLKLQKNLFTHCAIILALQNTENTSGVIANAALYLKDRGRLLIVLNHPMFRIPRQTKWGIDEQNKLQYRAVFRYLTPLKIPITMNPGSSAYQRMTWSFHYPLEKYSTVLLENHFFIEKIEEWTSDKKSVGRASKMENRSRNEIPLFMAITAIKNSKS